MNTMVRLSIEAISKYLKDSNKLFYEDIYGQSSYEDPLEVARYYIDKAFIELLVLMDFLKLENTYSEFKELYNKAKSVKEGLTYSEMGTDEPYLVWPGEIRKYLIAVANITNTEIENFQISQDLIEIIRHSIYSILDNNLFECPPANELEFQTRIESILKCVYPDMLHEPTISKQIKSFRPDTGIPSLKTLIEYKYISNVNDSKVVADQILADTRGYSSNDWNKFLFVIYETKRIKHEKDWRQLLRNCDTARNIDIVVLSGEPKTSKKAKLKSLNKTFQRKPKQPGSR
ncbi:MAG: hypothetical protein VR65_04425 [Desulfobulbaceae bacterium BRH_c16a]|nr:MAG: hypothetical protein VR65_04425 [Desulfobulbaceae bacterium BRH_c16a]